MSESHGEEPVSEDSSPTHALFTLSSFDTGFYRCPKEIKDYFDLVNIFPCVCVWLAWEIGQ